MAAISPTERAQAATKLRLHEQYVYQVLTGRRTAPLARCHEFEQAFAGRICCEQLRPDVPWHRVPDADWPWHPAGRPLIDVARVLLTTQEVRDAA
jgi:hypothetical protein